MNEKKKIGLFKIYYGKMPDGSVVFELGAGYVIIILTIIITSIIKWIIN